MDATLDETTPDAIAPGEAGEIRMALHAERVCIGRRRVVRGVVRAVRTTRTREHVVDEEVTDETVETWRVPIGRPVDMLPPVRVEGDVTIMSVVHEVIMTERRLMLVEEIHMRRVKSTRRHVEKVILREQDVVIDRTEGPGSA